MLSSLQRISGQRVASQLRLAIVVSRFNEFITDRLCEGAMAACLSAGLPEDQLTVVSVPGAMELPLTAKKMAESGQYDAIMALGCIIRGSTDHYDYVCSETAKGIMSVGLSTGVPVLFGVLTTHTLEQAIERAGSKAGNKGAETAWAAIEMANLLKAL